VINPSLPVQSVTDLLKFARDRKGELSFASTGPGTPHHLFAELLKRMTGIEMTHVPYKGAAPALNDVVAGHIEVMISDVAPALPLIMDGKVRALGVTSKDRVRRDRVRSAHCRGWRPRLRCRVVADDRRARRDAEGYRRAVAPRDKSKS